MSELLLIFGFFLLFNAVVISLFLLGLYKLAGGRILFGGELDEEERYQLVPDIEVQSSFRELSLALNLFTTPTATTVTSTSQELLRHRSHERTHLDSVFQVLTNGEQSSREARIETRHTRVKFPSHNFPVQVRLLEAA